MRFYWQLRGYLLVAGKRIFTPSTRVRFSLALPLLLTGWAVGQNGGTSSEVKDLNDVVTADLQSTEYSPVTIVVGMDKGPERVIVLCDPVFDDKGKWTPHVKNCKLQNEGTLEEVINSMSDMLNVEREQYHEELDRYQKWGEKNLKIAKKAIALTRRANTNADNCAASLRSVADSIRKEVKK